MDSAEVKATEYICIECKNVTSLKPKDPIRCSQCGKNILYKTRDKTATVQLQAL